MVSRCTGRRRLICLGGGGGSGQKPNHRAWTGLGRRAQQHGGKQRVHFLVGERLLCLRAKRRLHREQLLFPLLASFSAKHVALLNVAP